jgi:hypothetical protein
MAMPSSVAILAQEMCVSSVVGSTLRRLRLLKFPKAAMEAGVSADDVYQIIDGDIYNGAIIGQTPAIIAKCGGSMTMEGAKELWESTSMHSGENEGVAADRMAMPS